MEKISVRLRSSRRRSLRVCQDELTISKKELKRIKILEQIGEKRFIIVEGTDTLVISIRQTYRILKKYPEEVDEGVIHQLRGKPSNRGYLNELKEEVMRIYRKSYGDFGPTFFTEKLEERHKIKLDHKTVRR